MVNGDNTITMTSLEIAEVTGKLHKNVTVDISKMLNKLGKADAEFLSTASYKVNNATRHRKIYQGLTKSLVMALMAHYDFKVGYAMAQHIEKLESQSKFAIPQSYGEALQLAATQTAALELKEEQLQLTNEKLELSSNKVIEQAPKANYYDKVVECEGLLSATQIAIKLGTTANKLNKFLMEQGNVYDARSSKKVFVSGFVHHGYGRMVTSIYKEQSVSSCKFTPKGEALLVRLFVSDVEQIVRNDPFAKFMK